jgi:G:T-mismatch repair DNA endonuclease (very short patch repair protein)
MLRREGWSILVVWQCQLKKAGTLPERFRKFFHHE